MRAHPKRRLSFLYETATIACVLLCCSSHSGAVSDYPCRLLSVCLPVCLFCPSACLFLLGIGLLSVQSGAEMEGQEAAAMEGAGEEMMQQMMGEFGKMGEKEVDQEK